MSECLNLKKNLSHCTCTYEPCSKKGMCCECLRYHLSMGQLLLLPSRSRKNLRPLHPEIYFCA